ncbi:unnamed protein product, partial [Ascophyllum nodosum]
PLVIADVARPSLVTEQSAPLKGIYQSSAFGAAAPYVTLLHLRPPFDVLSRDPSVFHTSKTRSATFVASFRSRMWYNDYAIYIRTPFYRLSCSALRHWRLLGVLLHA